MKIIKNSEVQYQVQIFRDGIWWTLGEGITADIAHKRAASKDGYLTAHRRTLEIITTKETKIIEDSEGPRTYVHEKA